MRMTLEHKQAYVVMTTAIVVFIVGSILYLHPLKWSEAAYLFSHDILIFVISLTAVLLSFCIFKHKFDSNGAWKFFLLGFGLWAAAEFIWFFYEGVLGVDPFPSLADLFWLAGYLPLAMGLIMYVMEIKAKDIFRNFLVSITGVTASTFAIIFIFGVNVFPSDVSLFEGILLLAYPIGDIFLLLLSVLLLKAALKHKEHRQQFVSWACLAGGFLLFAVYDIMFSYLVTSEQMSHMLFNIVYLGAYLLVAMSAFSVIISKSRKISYPYQLTKLTLLPSLLHPKHQ